MQSETAFEGLDAPTRTRIERTFSAVRERGITPIFVPDVRAALDALHKRIPKGAAVAHGSSTTLQEIGFIDHLKKVPSGYRYLNPEWQAEDDPTRRGRIRAKLSVEADYFLGSVQAISETGEVIAADASGNRQAFYVYGPSHVIWVAGINKLVPTVEAGIRRVREVALPLEPERVRRGGGTGSYSGKLVVYDRERAGRTTLIAVANAAFMSLESWPSFCKSYTRSRKKSYVLILLYVTPGDMQSINANPWCWMPFFTSSAIVFTSPLKARATYVAPDAKAREIGSTGFSMTPSIGVDFVFIPFSDVGLAWPVVRPSFWLFITRYVMSKLRRIAWMKW